MNTYIVHRFSSKEKNIVKRCETEDEVITFITAVNKGSVYLKSETFESFEYNDERDDGVYIVKDNNFVRSYKMEHLVLDGFLYSSTYIVKKVLNEYELIQGNTAQL